MKLYIKLAWRNIWRNRRRTIITASSIAFAVFFAVLPESMNRGSHDQMIDNMARFHTGFLQIQDEYFEKEPSLDNAMPWDDELARRVRASDPDITTLIPRIETFMLVSSEETTRGGFVLGIDPEKEQQLNQLKDRISEGRFFGKGEGTAVIGRGFARRLNVEVGDTLVLLGQGRFGMTAAGLFPVSGIMDHPITEMSNQVVYLSLVDAQWLLSAYDHVTSLLVTPATPRLTDKVARSLRSELQGQNSYVVKTWPELMPELLQAIEFDNAGQYVISGILYMVIALGLLGTILTMTMERTREFGVLLSVGMQRRQLGKVVFIETLLISVLGLLAGLVISFLITFYFYFNPIPLTGDAAQAMLEFGFEPVLPFAISPDLFYKQMIIVFMLSMVICLYPMGKIFRLNILEAARK